MALAMITASVFGAIGESPRDMESGTPEYTYYNDDTGETSLGWSVVYRAFGARSIRHLGVFKDGAAVAEAFQFWDKHQMTRRECEVLLRPYAQFKRSRAYSYKDGVRFDLLMGDGAMFGYVVYANRQLNIYSAKAGRPLEQPFVLPNFKPEPEPDSGLQPALKNDCMVTATENYHRLVTTSAWASILRFQVYVNGKHEWGHAIAVWKIKGDSKILAVDSSGTFELRTTSTALEDVVNALQVAYTKILHAKGYQGDIVIEQAQFGVASKTL